MEDYPQNDEFQNHSQRQHPEYNSQQQHQINIQQNQQKPQAQIEDVQQDGYTLFIFRENLRLHDNRTLQVAIDNDLPILPVICFNIEIWQKQFYEFQSMGPYRQQFLIESCIDLTNSLEKIGGSLHVFIGSPKQFVQQLMAIGKTPNIVVSSVEVGNEAQQELDELSELLLSHQNTSFSAIWDNTAINGEDIPFSHDLKDLPANFQEFLTNIGHNYDFKTIPTPSTINLVNWFRFTTINTLMEDETTRNVFQPRHYPNLPEGGESVALSYLNKLIWDEDRIRRYKTSKNSTRLGSWLAHGCISPRYIITQLQKYNENSRDKTHKAYDLTCELYWRDFFHFMFVKFKHRWFKLTGIKGEHGAETSLVIINDRNDYKRWVSGTTGYTYVDACMKCLQSTGYLHDNGRCVVAMFLTKVLKCDWRWGAEAFRYYLIDHDAASNVANWQSIAGVGNELKKERARDVEDQELKFNPIIYGMQNEDDECSFIKKWLPCFGGLPNVYVHEPWKTPNSINIPNCYRSPVVDPAIFNNTTPQSVRADQSAHDQSQTKLSDPRVGMVPGMVQAQESQKQGQEQIQGQLPVSGPTIQEQNMQAQISQQEQILQAQHLQAQLQQNIQNSNQQAQNVVYQEKTGQEME